jgi:hypothetical protein
MGSEIVTGGRMGREIALGLRVPDLLVMPDDVVVSRVTSRVLIF